MTLYGFNFPELSLSSASERKLATCTSFLSPKNAKSYSSVHSFATNVFTFCSLALLIICFRLSSRADPKNHFLLSSVALIREVKGLNLLDLFF